MTSRLERVAEGLAGAQTLRPPYVHALVGEHAPPQSNANPLALIVAGMHRSGTSALTRALSLCGLALPKTLMPGNQFNEDGYWESELIKISNDTLLKELDSAWDDILASRPARAGRHSPAAVESLKAVVGDQFDPAIDIVIKDPRISLVFGAWREALEELGYAPALVIPVRHPLEVAASLARRDDFPATKSLLLWLVHLLALERDSRDIPRVFVAYEDLLADWRSNLRRIERRIGFQLWHWTPSAELEIDRFLAPSRRHFSYEPGLLERRPDVPSWIADAYRWALEAARAEGEPSPVFLDAIAEEFHATADIYAPLLASERRHAHNGATAVAAPEGAPPAEITFALYSGTASAPCGEETCVHQVARLTRTPQSVSITTPLRREALTALRLDPGDAEGALLLQKLCVRALDGTLLWEWAGEQDLFSASDSVAAENLGAGAALLHLLNNDPQVWLPVGRHLGDHRQVVVELEVATADMADVAARRERTAETKALGAKLAQIVSQLAQAEDRSDRHEASLSAIVAGLRAELAETGAAHAQQLAAHFERRLNAVRDDVAAQARAAALAHDTELRAAVVAREAELQSARAAALAHEAELRAARERLGGIEEHLARLASNQQLIADLSQRVMRMTDERDLARAESVDLKRSRSWRLTAPLRAAKNFSALGMRKLRSAARLVKYAALGKTYADVPQAQRHQAAMARMVARSSLFDPKWYLAANPDVRDAGIDPLAHYLAQGGFEGRAPGPAFDSRWYLAQNPDVAAAGLNPLAHYLAAGRREKRLPLPPEHLGAQSVRDHARLLGRSAHWKHVATSAALTLDPVLPRGFARRLRGARQRSLPPMETAPAAAAPGSAAHVTALDQLFATASGRGADYAPLTAAPIAVTPRVKAIAFYLPQFHPIPENDAWWGKGFTEWTNVSKAVPQFVGHYQPRLPDELGFYDLRLVDVQRRQVELAKQHGVYGFCFHYYWFTGRKRLLERPLNQFVASDIDFPFCVCWANENWTRRWDGLDQDILMEQRHEPQDDRQFIEDLAPLLADPRYIRIDGRPLIIVYRVDILPDAQRTAETWRDYCRAHGLGDPYLVAAQTFGFKDPRPHGFDAAVEFPPHADYSPEEVTRELTRLNPKSEGRVYSYERVARREMSSGFPDYTLFKGVIPGWDNEARKPGKGHAFAGATPALYRSWLAEHCRKTDRRYANPDEKLVFINAWNEWAEGAYLEPDRRYGYAFLEATKQALQSLPQGQIERARPPLHVIVHAFYADVFAEILGYIRRWDGPLSLCVTCPPDRAQMIRKAFAASGLSCPFEVVEVENRGRDVMAFFEALKRLPIADDAVILKVHTKKSTHRGDGADWRREMLDRLMAPATVEQALDAFASDEKLGLVAPANYIAPITTYIGFNQQRIEALLKRGGWKGLDMQADVFAAGTMFFIRRRSLDRLLALKLTRDDFEVEAGQKDGTLAHALERMFALAVLRDGGRMIDTDALFGGAGFAANADFAFAVKTDYLYKAGRQNG